MRLSREPADPRPHHPRYAPPVAARRPPPPPRSPLAPRPRWPWTPYSDAEYHRRERLCLIAAFVGGAWLLRMRFAGAPSDGIATALAAVFSMACFGTYRTRRTERGVWTVALLFGGGAAAVYTTAVAMEVVDTLRHRSATPWPIVLDFAAAGLFAEVVARASWTVFLQNRSLPR